MKHARVEPRNEVIAGSRLVELAPIPERDVNPRPPKTATKLRPRGRRGGMISFLICVLIPVAITVWYLAERAQHQFSSASAFAVRSEDTMAGLDVLSGFAAFANNSSSDLEILDLFLKSQDIVLKVQEKIDLRRVWSNQVERDPVFSFDPEGTIEDLSSYWRRMVSVDYEASSGLIEIQVRAFDADDAKAIVEVVLEECIQLINQLSVDAQREVVASAMREHDNARDRLRDVRLEISALRASTGMADPEAGLSGEQGVVQKLQETLAEELVKLDLLRRNLTASGTARGADVRMTQAEIKIDVLKSRIVQEREKFGANGGHGYSEIIAKFEELLVDQSFAEEAYVAATAALDVARAESRRRSRHLAVIVKPSRAEKPLYPRSGLIVGMVGFFSILVWAIGALVYQSLHDRRAV